MEVQMRRIKFAQDAENIHVNKTRLAGKAEVNSRSGLQVRGALGDVSNRLPLQQNVQPNKIASAVAEFEKKAVISKSLRSFKHVSSKIDTGLQNKPANNQQQINVFSKPSLRREESTAGQAIRAVAQRNKVTLKSLKSSDSKENIPQAVNSDLKKIREKKVVKPAKETSKEKVTKETAKSKELQFKDFVAPELPEDIEDIDAGDENSPVLLSIYIKDIYNYLKYMEAKYEVKADFLEGQTVITANMRSTLLNWLVEVHSQFNLQHETFQLTVAILDRYLQCVKTVNRKDFQLIGVTAMFIASKYEEIFVPDISDFVYITDNSYNKKEILNCEKAMIKKLEFSFGRPLPLHFLRRFVKAARGTARNHHLAKYFIDLALLDASVAHHAPSLVAAAGLALSLFLLGSTELLEDVWSPTLQYYSGYSFEQIEPVMFKIAKVLHDQEKSKWRAISKKYQQSSLAKVALLPQLKDTVIEEMAIKAK